MSWSISYPSQRCFGPYGHLICTPISCLAATTFLRTPKEDEIKSVFSIKYVGEMMEASHGLYTNYFSQRGVQLMIEDIYPWLSKDLFTIHETAGLIKTPYSITDDNSVVLFPLISLIQKYTKEAIKTSIVVTAQGHTICFMISEKGEVFLFDPLPASLMFIPPQFIESIILKHFGVDLQFSAIIIHNI